MIGAGIFIVMLSVNEKFIIVVIALALAIWIVLSQLYDAFKKSKPLSKSYLGMATAHIGFAVAIVGITMASFYSVEKDGPVYTATILYEDVT